MRKLAKRLTKAVLPMFIAGLIGGFIAVTWFNDDRVVVEDYVVGADFEITHVDGLPVGRQEHGWVITRVPYALVEPGKRTLTVIDANTSTSAGARPKEYTIEAQILGGFRYRMDKNEAGQPSLLAIAH